MTQNTTEPFVAFHNKKATKRKYIDRLKSHATADEIIKGRYWEKGRGCAVGCTIHSGDHQQYETELGIPTHLAYLEDVIFERLPNGASKEWPVRFLSAVRVGADLSLVWPKFAVWLLIDPKDGVIRFANTDRTRECTKNVAALWQRVIDGESIESLKDEFAAAAAADAWRAAAATAADAAAWRAAATADADAWRAMSDKLIELLEAA